MVFLLALIAAEVVRFQFSRQSSDQVILTCIFVGIPVLVVGIEAVLAIMAINAWIRNTELSKQFPERSIYTIRNDGALSRALGKDDVGSRTDMTGARFKYFFSLTVSETSISIWAGGKNPSLLLEILAADVHRCELGMVFVPNRLPYSAMIITADIAGKLSTLPIVVTKDAVPFGPLLARGRVGTIDIISSINAIIPNRRGAGRV
ncbi:hypothetical protein D4765_15865 [Subtercola vilae]|uniref:Uncharacterized protein n=2 Tax=Subtercola vilae TaxID=2056433 RepID=A0A4T2BRS8_9MICO|nr:hypothetical protein D4765_15865 [Subtercola vilae]